MSGDAIPATPPAAGGRPNMRLYVMTGSLCAVFMIGQLYRYATAVVAPDIAREMDLAPEVLGAISGTLFFSFAVMQIPVGILVDRFGARWTIAGFQVLALAGPLVVSQAQNARDLIIGAALMGVGAGANLMAPLVAYARWFPPARYATLVAITIGVGGGLGQVIASSPLARFAEAYGWRATYIAISVLVAIVASIAVALVRDDPPGVERRIEGAPDTLGGAIRGMSEVLSTANIWRMAGASALGATLMFAFRTMWAGPYLAEIHGLDTVARGDALLLITLAMLAGTLLYGPLDRHFDRRKAIVMTGLTATVTIFALLAILPAPPTWLALSLLVILGAVGTFDVVLLAHERALFPHRLAGRGLTTINTFHFSGIASLQLGTGLVVGAMAAIAVPTDAYRLCFALFAGLGVIALLLYRKVPDRRPSAGFQG